MNFTVIIPTFNEQHSISKAIESALSAGAAKILIADGGSTDQTKETVSAYPECTFLNCPVSGRGHQQRFACDQTNADILLFLHADSQLHCDAFAQIESVIKKYSSSICWGGFYQRIENQKLAFRFLEFGNWLRSRLFGLVYGDQGIWVTAEALQKAGGIPPVPIMEDVVLSQTLRRLSWPVMLSPKMKTSARRWEKDGILKRTLSNWKLLWRFKRGASPEEILKSYRPNKEQ